MNNSKYNLSISYLNELRTITIKHQTRICDIIKKAIDNFDLTINEIAGIYFYFYDANVYFCESDDVDFQKTYGDFIEDYTNDIERIYIIEPLNISSRNRADIDNFKNRYLLFTSNVSNNYYHRPTINITNNYYHSENEQQRRSGTIYDYYIDIFRPEVNTGGQTPGQQPRQTQPQQQSQTQSPTQNLLSSLFNGSRTYSYTGNLQNYTNILNTLQNILTQNDINSDHLSEEEVNRLPRGRYSDLLSQNLVSRECTHCNITLEELRSNTNIIALPCKHGFQESAIKYWLLNSSNKCPVCRAEVRT